MEFKDKLRKIRIERGVSQQALADAIFVSRSAVAKWESGLGYPNETSYTALLNYFQVDRSFFETEEVEEVIVEKNKHISGLKVALSAISVILLLVLSVLLPHALLSGNYGFTSEMAAGAFANDECIQLEDYDIYWYNIMKPEKYACIAGFRPVKKTFYGYVVQEEDYNYREVYCNGENVAILYSIEGKNGYYNIWKNRQTIVEFGGDTATTTFFEPLLDVDVIWINGKEYEVQYNSFFITDDPVTEFSIGEFDFTVSE